MTYIVTANWYIITAYVAFEVFYMYLVYTPDGIVLVRVYYITRLNISKYMPEMDMMICEP